MKKIATITTHAAINPGAVLQAYALQKHIEKAGLDCDILNYVPSHVKKSYSLVEKPHNFHYFLVSLFQILNLRSRIIKRNNFRDFRNNYLKLSGEELHTHRELVAQANKYDTVVFGSDQIWNPSIHKFDEGYFLSFPEMKARKVSYAASFGQDNINDTSTINELKRRLSGFEHFACREYSAQNLIKTLAYKDSTLVLDPVFLLDSEEWKALAEPISSQKKFTLAYFLSNPGNSPFAIKKYSKKIGADAFSLGFSLWDYKYGLKCDYRLSPQSFLGYISQAECIMTNSFHCTAFSILMKKNFYTRMEKSENSRNDRMITLLKELELEDRLYYDEDADKLDFSKPIDYDKVYKILNEKIKISKDYLSEVL